jgi:Peptidase family M23
MYRFIPRLARLMMAAAIAIVALLLLTARAQSEEQPQKQTALSAKRRLPADRTMVGPVVWSPLATSIYPVKGADGRIHLIYELHVTNESHLAVCVRSIEVLDARDNSVTGVNRVVSPGGVDVTGKVRPFALPQTQDAANYVTRLGPGQSGVVYFDVTYNAPRDLPKSIKHRFIVALRIPDQGTQVFTVIGSATKVNQEEALVIAPPLKGGNWLVANGSGPIITPHRYIVQPTNGSLRPPEHFAIDLIQLDAQGRAYTGDPTQLKNWPYYGTEVISATPGKVVEVVNDLNDQIPTKSLPTVSADTAAGNHVIVEIGNGRYALYAHLAPGSVAVSEGDFVQPGQLLGHLGNSGNSDAPHLHFQIMDSPSALNANGLPFVFKRVIHQGQLMGALDEVIDTLVSGKAPVLDARGAAERALQMPLTLNVIGFN